MSRRRKKSSSIGSSAGRISTRSTPAHIGSGHYYSHGDRKGKTSICRIDQEGSCNTRNAYQATTHSTSMIKRMIQPHARTFSSNFLTSSSNTIMPKTSSELSQHGENWVKYARSMRRELLSDAALYSTFFEQECCTTLRPIHGLKKWGVKETQIVKLESLNRWKQLFT